MGDDASLDEFFAKKDKSKKKKSKSSKFTNADLLGGGEETEKTMEKLVKKTKKKKDKSDNNAGGENSENKGNLQKAIGSEYINLQGDSLGADDEWNDYEVEEKDFSGLKIQNLQISEKVEAETENKSGEEDNEDSDSKSKDTGVWAAGGHPQPVSEPVREPTPEPKPEAKEDVAPPCAGGPSKYVPPSMRFGSSNPDKPASSNVYRGRKKEAPNIQSNLDFPSLGGGVEDAYMSKGRNQYGVQYETVRTGNRQLEDPKIRSGHLELGNKFDCLAD